MKPYPTSQARSKHLPYQGPQGIGGRPSGWKCPAECPFVYPCRRKMVALLWCRCPRGCCRVTCLLMCPPWQVSPASTPCAVVAWPVAARALRTALGVWHTCWALGRPPNSPGEQTQLFTALNPDLGLQPVLMGLGEAIASASESHVCSHISGKDRQSPATRLSRNPEAWWLLGRKRSKGVGGPEVHSGSGV